MADCEKNCGRGVWQHVWFHNNVPEGYVWQKATIGTGAGWIRPHPAREKPPGPVPVIIEDDK